MLGAYFPQKEFGIVDWANLFHRGLKTKDSDRTNTISLDIDNDHQASVLRTRAAVCVHQLRQRVLCCFLLLSQLGLHL